MILSRRLFVQPSSVVSLKVTGHLYLVDLQLVFSCPEYLHFTMHGGVAEKEENCYLGPLE